jgi:hypothetical protein
MSATKERARFLPGLKAEVSARKTDEGLGPTSRVAGWQRSETNWSFIADRLELAYGLLKKALRAAVRE